MDFAFLFCTNFYFHYLHKKLEFHLRQVKRWLEVSNSIRWLLPFGDVLIVVDVKSSIHVMDVETGDELVLIETSGQFDCSAITHPATYLNKVLLGSRQGPFDCSRKFHIYLDQIIFLLN